MASLSPLKPYCCFIDVLGAGIMYLPDSLSPCLTPCPVHSQTRCRNACLTLRSRPWLSAGSSSSRSAVPGLEVGLVKGQDSASSGRPGPSAQPTGAVLEDGGGSEAGWPGGGWTAQPLRLSWIRKVGNKWKSLREAFLTTSEKMIKCWSC